MNQLMLYLAQGLLLALIYAFLFAVVLLVARDLRRHVPQRPRAPMAPGSGELLVVSGQSPARGERFELNSSVITLGRDASNQIVIGDPFVSGAHTRIAVADGGYWVEDLGSRNGTYVNGERVESSRLLEPGDRLEVGDTVFRFEARTAPPGGRP